MDEIMKDMGKVQEQLQNLLFEMEMEKGDLSLEYLELAEIALKTKIYIKKHS